MIAFIGIFKSYTYTSNQPPPFIIDENTYIQPILENETLEEKYQYTRTIKFYYIDPMPEPVVLRNGNLVRNYCSDRTQITLITLGGDTIKATSTQNLNCRISAIVNFEQEDVYKLTLSKLKILKIKNLVTDNEYTYYLVTDYFQKYLKP
jgi:hypothetical protein